MKAFGGLALVSIALAAALAPGASQAAERAGRTEGYDLSGPRTVEPRYYRMETKVLYFGKDGKRQAPFRLVLHLSAAPEAETIEEGCRYTCHKFTLQHGEESVLEVPALTGWSYLFKGNQTGRDEHGQELGIPHARFEGLTDQNGAALHPQMAYAAYNMFIDFHAFCDVFGRPTQFGQGIQNLKRPGDRIVHSASQSEPSMELGSSMGEGSVFRHGEVTLEFKGLAELDGVPCALVGYDSGDCSFTMFTEAMPGMKVKVDGGSHYWGDIYVELDSRWVRRATRGEIVVSQAKVGDQMTIDQVFEVTSVIERLSEAEFDNLS